MPMKYDGGAPRDAMPAKPKAAPKKVEAKPAKAKSGGKSGRYITVDPASLGYLRKRVGEQKPPPSSAKAKPKKAVRSDLQASKVARLKAQRAKYGADYGTE